VTLEIDVFTLFPGYLEWLRATSANGSGAAG